MPLSLRSPAVEGLARRMASHSGCNITDTIQHALELMESQLTNGGGSLAARLTDISARCAALPDLDTRSAEAILGYGPDGMPE